MAYPFNHITFGVAGQSINSVIEIPKGSMLKIEWDRKQQFFVLDRVEPGIFAKPVNYGFIPQSLDDDGDELDTLVLTEEPLPTGLVLQEARVIGIMNFEDDGEMDHKIICVPGDDRHEKGVRSFKDLSDSLQEQLTHHFSHYKDLKKPGSTKVLGFGDEQAAWQVINECVERAVKNRWW